MSLDFIKLLAINIREYISDILLLVVTGLLVDLLPELYSTLDNLLHAAISGIIYYSFLRFQMDENIFPLNQFWIRVAIWILLFFAMRSIIKWIYGMISHVPNNKYNFDYETNGMKLSIDKLKKDWIFQGNIFSDDNGLEITNSDAGCFIKPTSILSTRLLINPKVWKNFQANIKMNFSGQLFDVNSEVFNPYLGVLFRAQNFDDYFMLELVIYKTKYRSYLIIRPHIRISGNWDAPILNPDRNVKKITIPRNNNIELRIKVIDREVEVYLNKQPRPALFWLLPTHTQANLLRQDTNKKETSKSFTTQIYFQNNAGMFGFRNYGNELAVIKSLDIHSI